MDVLSALSALRPTLDELLRAQLAFARVVARWRIADALVALSPYTPR